jgi:beta-galactosidase
VERNKKWGHRFRPPLVDKVWYEREVEVPATWKDRAVVLDLARVGTDAVVFVNGQRAGAIAFPFGNVDITEHVRPGQNLLRIEVTANRDSEYVADLQGAAANQQTRKRSELKVKGLLDDVTLMSRPRGAHISDVFVQTSVRKKTLTLDVELRDVKQPGEVGLVASVQREGRREHRFEAAVRVEPNGVQRVSLPFAFPNPKLWDLDNPNLYTLELEAKGAGLDDVYAQRFGFREFWIEGTSFVLNGVPFKPRPINKDGGEWSQGNGNLQVIDGLIRGYRSAGYNVLQSWPEDLWSRSLFHFEPLWYSRCDELGMPIYGIAKNMAPSIVDADKGWRYVWEDEGVKERYRHQMEAGLRRVRNHPSVLMWASVANFYGGPQDQNPRNLGQRWAGIDPENDNARRLHQAGEEATALIQAADPTRPVYSHSGSVGCCHTTNHYLNFIPLAEREEWLSHYAKHGKIPFFPVEFGTPYEYSYARGRNGFGAPTSEPWLTEFAAIYLGNEAYRDETAEYRELVRSGYAGGTAFQFWQGARPIWQSPAAQRLQALFIENTWRSWRAMGATGGMIPWGAGNLFAQRELPVPNQSLSPTEGARGTYFKEIPLRLAHYLTAEGGFEAGPGARALVENNGETLAYLAGPKDALTAKDSRFYGGDTFEKQVILINDTRGKLPFELTWELQADGRRVLHGTEKGSLEPARILAHPLGLKAPAATKRTAAKLLLTARIGKRQHRDELELSLFPRPPASDLEVRLIDPVGKTRALLEHLGVRVQSGDTPATDGSLTVIGREALSSGYELSRSVEEAVRRGGRLLVMSQQPEFVRKRWGYRVGRFPARRAFPVDAEHPLLAGLTAADLIDWNGESTLVEARPTYAAKEIPKYGWHWGNRGAVSSAPLEKPHRSGWRPLLETEFDLAYSPLLELDHGAGRVVLCQLDLEDKAPTDPAARLLAAQLLEHVAKAPLPAPRRTVFYVGDAQGELVLRETGVRYERSPRPRGQGLVVVGPGAKVSSQELDALARGGANVLVLAGRTPGSHFGASLAQVSDFHGSLSIPTWPEARGLSASDLRLKVGLEWTVVKGGAELGAGGMLARRALGKGTVLYAQLDPLAVDTSKSYLRLTRWRQTRALSQLLANLGASFEADTRIFRSNVSELELAGPWKMAFTKELPAAPSPDKKYTDDGVSAAALRLSDPAADDSGLASVNLPSWIEELKTADGEVVVRRTIDLPADWAGKQLELELGAIDDYDTTYFNGQSVGTSNDSTPNVWSTPRRYVIPRGLARAGRNVIVIRFFDAFGGGGFAAAPEHFVLRIAGTDTTAAFYSADYRTDHEFGDEPYRYYRW